MLKKIREKVSKGGRGRGLGEEAQPDVHKNFYL